MQAIPVEIIRLDCVDSTSLALARLIRLGAPEGSAVIASEQSAGRGQRGRLWFSPPGVSLYVSFCCRCPSGPEGLPFAAGLACARTLRAATGVPACVRWPNDVLINGRKAGGVLIESSPRDGEWIVGCGLNINNPAFPADLEQIATSARLESGRQFALEDVEPVFFQQMRSALALLESGGLQAALNAWRELDVTPGCRVRVRQADTDRMVEAVRVNEDGHLVTREGESFATFAGASLVEWEKGPAGGSV